MADSIEVMRRKVELARKYQVLESRRERSLETAELSRNRLYDGKVDALLEENPELREVLENEPSFKAYLGRAGLVSDAELTSE
jgi:hypothetical protein